jgi:AAA domain
VRAEQLNFGDLEELELALTRPDAPPWLAHAEAARAKPRDSDKPREVFLRSPPGGRSGHVEIHSVDGRERADATAADDAALQRVLSLGGQAITWVAQTTGAILWVHVHTFTSGGIPVPGLTVGVDDVIVDKVRENLHNPQAPFAVVRDWLISQLTLPCVPGGPPGQVRIVHSSTPAADGSAVPDAFTLLGHLWAADIALRDGKLQVTRLLQTSHRRGQRWPRLSHTALSFAHVSAQQEASEAIRAALAGLVREGKSYLELWRAYDELEWQVLIGDALRLGVPRYSAWRPRDDGHGNEIWNFSLVRDGAADQFFRELRQQDDETEIEAAEDPPPELTGGAREGRGRSARGTVLRPHHEDFSVDVVPAPSRGRQRTEPPRHGTLFLSLSGYRVSQGRRVSARDRIWSGTAEMHGLAQLIEGVGVPTARTRSLARYDRVLERVAAETGATPSQKKALRLALETPDVLLVQGPPGTGKTQFITALLRCLDATGESARAFNRTLITSYQHHAVDNMVRKARSRGLPPARIDSDKERGSQSAQQLRADIVKRVTEQVGARPEFASRQRLKALQTLTASYDESPSAPGDLADTLDQTARLAGGSLPGPLAERLALLRAQASARADAHQTLLAADHAKAVRAARSLRPYPGAFADDGPDRSRRASSVLDELGLLDGPARELLDTAATWEGPSAPPFLPELASLRLRLLARLGTDSRALSPVPARDPDVQELLHEIVEAAERRVSTEPESVDEVLADYLTDLSGNVTLIQDTLSRYSAVLASTVQQADSQAMSRAVDAPLPVFGSVIVDEAARANPLDLMIPMSCARDRIVLVGDHKQLPHAMEQRIERELQRTGQFADTSGLQESLFQRWFNMFSGELPRVRTITLDEQFRMHPALGTFVSSVFYGSPAAVRSHPSTRDLTHDLVPYQGKVAAWIDVPNDGGETRIRNSVIRRPEAEQVVAELVALAGQDVGRQLTFGIISFYKQQVAAIEDELFKAGLLVPDDENQGTIKPVPRFEWTDEPQRRTRLRVGTVDAFQGMEFDVVILSVTRSNLPNDNPADIRAALRRYGYLTSEQRMCVAMSRQRRLLIAVGDAEMANRGTAPRDPGAPGRSLVEGLVAFRELCEGPAGAGVRS